jgi:hypothetical protein
MSTATRSARAVRARTRNLRGNPCLKKRTRAADAVDMERSSGTMLRRTGALAIAALAASDLLYRLLLRESLRRALGMQDERSPSQ